MRQLIKQIALLERVDRLIGMKATGSPKQLANRLGVSEATVFRMIETMKELEAPICYDFTRQSYTYSEPTKFRCGFYIKALDEKTSRSFSGGDTYINLQMALKF
jgi:hypothetical protein